MDKHEKASTHRQTDEATQVDRLSQEVRDLQDALAKVLFSLNKHVACDKAFLRDCFGHIVFSVD